MNARQSSCNIERLQQSLDDRLPQSERADLERHLESCPSCRQQLESLAAPKALWDDVTQLIGVPKKDVEVERAIGRLTRARPVFNKSPITLEPGFLYPPKIKKSLGRIGRYDVLEIIGEGGMGLVFKAVDARLNRTIALKVVSSQRRLDVRSKDRFMSEARAGASVVHKNVVAIYEAGRHRDTYYLAMEYVPGASLREWLTEGPLSIHEALDVAAQVARGLEACHARGLIHRDVKPGNILRQKNARLVKLSDFGLARTLDAPSITRAGAIAGTPEYMAPEQVAGLPMDGRADVFSLGAVLYTMLTRKSPFKRSTLSQSLHAVIHADFAPLAQRRKDLPAEVVALVDNLFAVEADNRPTASQAAVELERLASRFDREPQGRRGTWSLLPPFDSGFMRFECPLCGKRLKAPPRKIGHEARCMRCGALLGIPGPDQPTPVKQVDENLWNLESLGARMRWKRGFLIKADLRGVEDVDNLIGFLAEYQSLRTLLLSTSDVTDSGIQQIGILKELRVLTLSRTVVSDLGLEWIARLPKLVSLTLAHTGVTDQGLDCLHSLTTLRRLRLDQTPVSKAAIAALKEKHPQLKVWC